MDLLSLCFRSRIFTASKSGLRSHRR